MKKVRGKSFRSRFVWILLMGALLAAILLLAIFGKKTVQQTLSEELGVDVTAGRLLYQADDHGGFHGDGTTYIILQFQEEDFVQELKAAQWQRLPLEETAEILLYGHTEDNTTQGPYLQLPEEMDLPEIRNGFWFFRDDHPDAQAGQPLRTVLERSSVNFTAALYDADAHILYYVAQDT